jgi:hypothetical protein
LEAIAVSLLDGRAIDAILALLAIEGLALIAWRVVTGGGPHIVTAIVNLVAGACLLLAMRAALTGASTEAIGGYLALACAAHVSDLAGRWRPASQSRQATHPAGESPSTALTPESFRA